MVNSAAEMKCGLKVADDALAQQTDDTALRAALKAERERVANHRESRSYFGYGHQLAIEVRARGTNAGFLTEAYVEA